MASLLALSRAEQEVAKLFLRRRLWAHGATLVLGLLALVVPAPVLFALPGLALISEGVAWYLHFRGLEAHTRAEEGRRRATLGRELGTDPDGLRTAAIVAEFSHRARADAATWEDSEFFAATGDPGPERLRQSLQESAFWSCRLYRAAGEQVLIRLGVVVAVIVVALLVLFSMDAGSEAEAAARATTVVLAVLITTDELGIALSYFSAHRTAERVVGRLETTAPDNLGQMLAVYGDYATATAQAAPIPTKLHKRKHDAIDEAWRARSA